MSFVGGRRYRGSAAVVGPMDGELGGNTPEGRNGICRPVSALASLTWRGWVVAMLLGATLTVLISAIALVDGARVVRATSETRTLQLELGPGWTSLEWVGADGVRIDDALRDGGLLDKVVVVYHWDESSRTWLGFFPSLGHSAGINRLATFVRGETYWVAVTEAVEWVIETGPSPRAALGALPWMKDGVTEAEREGVDQLLPLARSSPRGFWELLRKPWLQDDLITAEVDVIRGLNTVAGLRSPRADDFLIWILGMPFLESVELLDGLAIDGLGRLASRNPALFDQALQAPFPNVLLTDGQAANVALLFMDQYEPGGAITVLPWVKDGVTEQEMDTVIDLQLLAAESPEVFRALLAKPWLRRLTDLVSYVVRDFGYIATGSARDSRSALQIARMPFLASLESSDYGATGALAGHHLRHPGDLPQYLSNLGLGSGVTDAAAGVLILAGLEQHSPDVGEALRALPWVADGITEHETTLVSGLVRLARKDLHLALAVAEHVDTMSRDLAIYLVQALWFNYDAWGDSLVDQPWFRDGLSGEEAALIVASSRPGIESQMLQDLLRTHSVQSQTISLPLAGDTNVWVIHSRTTQPEEGIIPVIDDISRLMESFLGLPFPTTDIILLVLDAEFSGESGHYGSHMVLDTNIGVVRNIPHETAHYYFHNNFQRWLNEGAAQFFEAYYNEHVGNELLSLRNSGTDLCLEEYENIRHLDYIREERYGAGPPLPCDYELGERLLIEIFQVVGQDGMASAMRDLYVPYERDATGAVWAAGPPTAEEVYLAFLEHAPKDRRGDLEEVFREQHGGAFAYAVKEFGDDHGDTATTATAVTVGQRISGMLDYMFDFDVFRFSAAAGQLYQMVVDHETLGYTSVTLYDQDGQTEQFGKWKARRRTPAGPKILWLAPASGTYYFAVQNFGGESGPYTLLITAPEDLADDHGDHLATASDTALGATVEGVIDSDFDFDYFRFQAVEGRTYRISVSGGTLELFRVRLHTSNGARPRNWLQFDDSAFLDSANLEWVAPDSGQYFLVVDGFHGSLGTYALTITDS